MAVDWELVRQFALTLGLGGLIGLERERHHDKKSVLAGVRTLPLLCLSGLLVTLAAARLDEPLLVVAGVIVAGGLAAILAQGQREEEPAGLTTPVAFLVTFLIGLLIGLGEELAALISGAATTALLMAKRNLHRLADVLTEEELRSALLLLVLAFIVYPFTPAEPFGPNDAIDVRQAILVVVLVSALSFISFLAMRRIGPARGLPWMGFLAGLANSVAAAAAAAGVAKRAKGLRDAAVLAVLAAALAMLARNLVIAGIADPRLGIAAVLAPPMLIVAGVLGAALILRAREATTQDDLPTSLVRNPFALGPALQFGVLFLALSVAGSLLSDVDGSGNWALYLTALGGIVATGPVFASMAALAARGGAEAATAASVCMVAAALSLLAKAVVAAQADRRIGRPLALPFGAAMATSLATAVALRLV